VLELLLQFLIRPLQLPQPLSVEGCFHRTLGDKMLHDARHEIEEIVRRTSRRRGDLFDWTVTNSESAGMTSRLENTCRSIWSKTVSERALLSVSSAHLQWLRQRSPGDTQMAGLGRELSFVAPQPIQPLFASGKPQLDLGDVRFGIVMRNQSVLPLSVNQRTRTTQMRRCGSNLVFLRVRS
jgi:hypothetical protein